MFIAITLFSVTDTYRMVHVGPVFIWHTVRTPSYAGLCMCRASKLFQLIQNILMSGGKRITVGVL